MNLDTSNFNKLKKFLDIMDDVCLLSLATTVTQGYLKDRVTTRKEAEDAVLRYSPDLLSILRRKCITKDLLLKYIHEERIPMSLPATKNELISRLLKFWGVPVETSNAGREIEHPQLEVKSLSPANNSANTVSQTNVELLAQQFSEWFFKMLNQPDQLPAEHFWPDAKLIIHFSSPLGEIMESREDNPEEISSLLFRTKVQHNLLFNPNLTAEGTKGRLEPHGLVAVMACGTLHSGQYCVGVFEQSFSLARDPLSENNWKIKHSRLNLRSNDNVTSLPALRCCD